MGRRRSINDTYLPALVSLEHGTYYYRRGKEKRVALGATVAEMENVLEQIGVVPTRMNTESLAPVYWHARKNAKSRGIAFDLSRQDVLQIWERSGGRCELTGLQFDLFKRNGYRRRPFAPSLDRVLCSEGYSVTNCRLVVVAINLALNEWGEDVFARIARAYLGQRERNFPTLKKYPTPK